MAIDLTERYHTREFQAEFSHSGRRIDWTVDRATEPVLALFIHHSAGYYPGVELDKNATEEEEIAQLDALAADHRHRFGIGPGYYYAGFLSGRLYAIGKYGTHRAHIKGRNPETQNWWNREALAIVAFGNYQTDDVPLRLWNAIAEGIEEVRGIVGERLPLHGHREQQAGTSCPGDNLMRWVQTWRDLGKPPDPTEAAIDEIKVAQGALGRALELLEAEG